MAIKSKNSAKARIDVNESFVVTMYQLVVASSADPKGIGLYIQLQGTPRVSFSTAVPEGQLCRVILSWRQRCGARSSVDRERSRPGRAQLYQSVLSVLAVSASGRDPPRKQGSSVFLQQTRERASGWRYQGLERQGAHTRPGWCCGG
jgi:hypothetical protein